MTAAATARLSQLSPHQMEFELAWHTHDLDFSARAFFQHRGRGAQHRST